MNDELISLNEVLNDGSKIYLYQQDSTNTWVAYGYSAFLLYHENCIKGLAEFSNYMQMPCVSISNEDFQSLVAVNKKIADIRNGYYLLHSRLKVDTIAYCKWVGSLKYEGGI